jgi:hypothetical protein
MNTCIYGVRVYTGITDVDGPIRLWTVLDPPGRFRVIPISGCIHFNTPPQTDAIPKSVRNCSSFGRGSDFVNMSAVILFVGHQWAVAISRCTVRVIYVTICHVTFGPN